MISTFSELLQYTFIRNAIAASFIASIVCGLVGTIIVEKKLVSISGGIAHSSFGGIGLGYLLNFEPIIGGLIFAVLVALAVSFTKEYSKTYSDTLIGIFWSIGMALGILFIALLPGYAPNMTSYLFGNILTISTFYLQLITLLTVVIIMVIFLFFNYWQAYLFDEQFLKALGINTSMLDRLLMVIIALCVISLVKIVGIVLTLALLTIPPAIARMYSHNFKRNITIASLLGLLLMLGGLFISYIYNIPSGATIVILSAIGFLFAVWQKRIARG